MTATPVILANSTALSAAGSASESSFAVGEELALTLQSTTGYTSFQWVVTARPFGSTAALTSATGFTSSLTTDLPGSYKIRGLANGGEVRQDVEVIVAQTLGRGLRKARGGERLTALAEKYNAALDELDLTAKVYNVKAYGARGDGTTDDTAAIQAAVDAAGAAGGGVVYLPQGIYKLSARIDVSDDNVTLKGDGRGTQINKVFADGAAIRFLGVTSWRLRDLYVQCLLDTTGTGVGVDIDGSSHGLCEGVRVYNPRHHGIRVAMTEAVSGAYYNEFRGCHVFNATVSADSAAIYVGTEANQTKISGGDYTSSSLGLYVSGAESVNCSGASFEGNNTAGARVGTFGGSSGGVNFTDCRFESAGVTQYGIWLDHASSYVAIKGGFPGGETAEIYNPRSSPYIEIGGFNPPSTTPAGGQYAYGLQTARGAKFAGMTWTNDGAGTASGAYSATFELKTTGANPLRLGSGSGTIELLDGTAAWKFPSAGRVYAGANGGSALYLQSAAGSGGVVVEGTGAFQTSSSTPMQAGSTLKVVGNVGFYNTSPQAKPTVSGSRGSNAALASLLTALATLGLITDGSS